MGKPLPCSKKGNSRRELDDNYRLVCLESSKPPPLQASTRTPAGSTQNRRPHNRSGMFPEHVFRDGVSKNICLKRKSEMAEKLTKLTSRDIDDPRRNTQRGRVKLDGLQKTIDIFSRSKKISTKKYCFFSRPQIFAKFYQCRECRQSTKQQGRSWFPSRRSIWRP